jgi:gliding motility-associated-like protein
VRDSVRLKVDSLPDLSIRRVLDKEVYCPGDTIYLLSNIYEPGNFPGITHEWLPFGTFLTPETNWNLVILASDTFTYQRISRVGGCVDTGEVFVPVFIPPTVTATAEPPIICPGETSQITVTVDPQKPEYQYEWSEQSAATLTCKDCLTPTAFPSQTEFYQITVKDLPCPAGASVAVFVENPPVLQLADDAVICSEGSVKLNNNSQLDVTYTWSPPTFLDNPTSAMPTATPTQTITYTVIAKGPNCQTEGMVTVQYFNAVIELGQDRLICEGDSVSLAPTVTGAPGSFAWLPTNQSSPSITVAPTALTTYQVLYNYGIGCSASDSVQVDVIPLPVLNLNPNTMICLGESVNLTLVPNGPGTFQWTPATFLNNANIPNPIATPTQTITYQVSAINQNCPPVQGSVTVEVANANVSAGSDQTICFGESVTLTAQVTGTQPESIVWTPGNFSTPSITVTPSITQTYTVRINYGVNCSDNDQVTVKVNPPIELSALVGEPDPRDSICEGTNIKLKVSVKQGSPVPASYQWLANGTPIPGATKDSLETAPQGTQVSYSVVATDANGCSVSSEALEYVTKRCFAIPNAFTPNGDGANDTFGPIFFGGTGTVLQFQIRNRWGQKVFEGTGDKPTWDGRSEGKDAPSDVYVYVMRIRFGNGEEEVYHGEVTLLR